MSDWMGLVWLVLLLAGNAFFVAAEFAVVAAERAQSEPVPDGGGRPSQSTQ
jgi:CBS domain containing-hemolysin-like protein